MRHDRNAARLTENVASDPIAVDWSTVTLPDAWPDDLDLRDPRQLLTYVRGWLGPRRKVELAPGLPGAERLPAYLRQEFHHLPNGVYSKRHADGYARWFDRIMLGHMGRVRTRLARELAGSRAALDLGCGTGGLAGALHAAGIPDVWGLEPSPYLLQLAAIRNPAVRFVQGIAESTGFAPARFDGVGACFLFHELPLRAADAALDEIHRILVPGGKLVIAEPSPLQLRVRTLVPFLRRWGLGGLYFWVLARRMHEPFVEGWHRRDVPTWLGAHGFSLVSDETGMPIRFVVACRS
jgi:SAM-dependent methyltransferase